MKILKKIIIIFLLIITFFSVSMRIMGFAPYSITTQSMEPVMSVNDLVYVNPVDFKMLNTGDIITYASEDGVTVTHRIVSIDKEKETVRTKGDNNEYPDALSVKKEQIIGKVIFSVPGIGIVTNTINSIKSKL